MTEVLPVAGKGKPPTLNKKVFNSKGPEQRAPEQMARTPANQDKEPLEKKKRLSATSTPQSADVFEATAAGASREISVMFSKFAEVLSKRAAADTSHMNELDALLTEAQNLESYLKKKKTHLKEALAQISDKLLD